MLRVGINVCYVPITDIPTGMTILMIGGITLTDRVMRGAADMTLWAKFKELVDRVAGAEDQARNLREEELRVANFNVHQPSLGKSRDVGLLTGRRPLIAVGAQAPGER